MKAPFVSRSHFEDVTTELRRQIEEQKQLNTVLMKKLGLIEDQVQILATDEPEVASDPIAKFVGRNRRISSIVQMAEKKLTETFREKYPVTAELDQLESKGRSLAHGS